MEGLTDRQQALLSLASAVLISVGGASVPAGVDWKIGFALAIVGAVGFGLKEVLGGKPKTPA